MTLILFSFLSIILLKLSYEDYKTKLVDAPTSLYASGIVTGFYLVSGRFIEFVVFAVLFLIAWKFLKPFCENKNLLGAGDVSILSFLLPALWFINSYAIGIFFILFGLTTLIIYRKQLTVKEEKPLVPIITIAWVLTWIVLQTLW